MKNMTIVLLGLMTAGAAMAKLPPLSNEEQAKAAETKNKNAWNDKVAAYQLCNVQDRVAARYLKEKGAAKPAVEMPPCQNPGPYVALQANTAAVGVADSKPVPQVGAKK